MDDSTVKQELELTADILIVPNAPSICDHKSIDKYGYSVLGISGIQVCFPAYIIGSDERNWMSSGHPMLKGSRLSDKIPCELFYGKKEGDIVNLSFMGKDDKPITCKLNINTQKYKYREQGRFEDLLYYLTQSFGGVCDASYFSPPLHERSQRAMLLVNHEKYARSVSKCIVEPTRFRFSSSYIKQCEIDAGVTPYEGPLEKLVNNEMRIGQKLEEVSQTVERLKKLTQ